MSHQAQEESKTESRISQYEDNERLPTQNRSLMTLEKSEIKDRQVTLHFIFFHFVITQVVTLSCQEMRNLYLHDCRDIL